MVERRLLLALLFASLFALFPAGSGLAGAAGLPAELPAEPAAFEAGNAVYQLVPLPVDDVVTLVTRLEFPGDEGQRAIDTFLLAGFATDEGGVPQSLAVRWRRDGWFQMWTLGLDSGPGVMPPSLRPGSGPRPGMQSLTLEGSKFPQAGHVYETTVSYAPRTGYLAVSVVDLTAGEPFYRNVFQLSPVDRPVYGGAGVLLRSAGGGGGHAGGPAITRWLPSLTPAGVRWRVIESEGESRWYAVTLLDRSKELFLEVDLGGDGRMVSFPGELRFVARPSGGGPEIPLASVTGGAGTLRLPIEAGRIPAGRLDIAMEYVQGGGVWFSDKRQYSVGLIRVLSERVEVDPAAGKVSGALLIHVDGAMDDFALEGRVEATARSLVEPSSQAFDQPLDRIISLGPDPGLVREPLRVEYEFPLLPEPHRWTLRLEVGVEAPEGVRTHVEVPVSMSVITGPADAKERVLATVTEHYFEEFLLGGSLTLGFLPPREDGSWADIDYGDQSVSGWKAVPHLDRVQHMARVYAHPQSVQRNSESLRGEIIRALRYWVENRFRNPNWWWNVIWQPQRLGDILLLMGDALPGDLREAALEIIRAEVLRPGANFTGANLVWNEGNRLRLGLVTGDMEMVAYAFEAMASEVRVMSFGKEGIQVDGSFHQHGSMLYSGGYGESFAGDLVRFAHVARGTSLFPPEALTVLIDYILDGQQWMVRRQTFDFSTTGRVLTRQQTSGNASYLIGLVRTLASLPDAPRKQELDAFLARLLGGGTPLTGNRYFWTSDFMTHHRPEFYVSVKASSTRTLATEIGNYENLKGHHLGDGMMFIMRTGTEYDQTFPVWNWEQLPGTTVRHMEHPLLLDGSWLVVRGAGDPAGGVSDGTYGAMAMHLKRDGLSARKAWFFFDREVVALGAEIQAPEGAEVTTSVNQARLVGNVVVGKDGASSFLEQGAPVALENPEWVYHDGVAYVFPKDSTVMAQSDVRTGRWSDVNSVYSNQLLSIPMFSLWFDHSGSGPHEYAYIVAPGIQQDEAPAYARDHGVAIVANNRAAQAVWHDGLGQLQAVFWEAGAVAAPSGLIVTVDAPALVHVRESEGGFAVTVGTLERKAGTITVRLAQAGAGERGGAPQAAEARFVFPEGDYLGRSVTHVLRPTPARQ